MHGAGPISLQCLLQLAAAITQQKFTFSIGSVWICRKLLYWICLPEPPVNPAPAQWEDLALW